MQPLAEPLGVVLLHLPGHIEPLLQALPSKLAQEWMQFVAPIGSRGAEVNNPPKRSASTGMSRQSPGQRSGKALGKDGEPGQGYCLSVDICQE